MTDPIERDLALGGAIDALAVPDHRPGFWDDLRAELRTAVPDDGGAPAALIDLEGHRRRRPSRRPGTRPLVLAAAAAAVVLAAGVAVAVRAGDRSGSSLIDSVGTTTSPTTSPATDPSGTITSASTGPSDVMGTTSPSPAQGGTVVDLPAPGQQFFLGADVGIVGLSPGGEVAYVRAEDPEAPQDECGGLSLYIQRVGEPTRNRAGAPGDLPITWTDVDAQGRIVAPAHCEGFASGLWVGHLGPDLVPVEDGRIVPQLTASEAGFDFFDTLDWTADGSGILIATGTAVYEIDPATGSVADLGLGRGLYVAEDSAGRMAVVLDSGQVMLDGRSLGSIPLRLRNGDEAGTNDGTMAGVTDLAFDLDGAVWVTTVDGVYRLRPGSEVAEIDSAAGWALFPTVAGMLWVRGTDVESSTAGLVDGQVVDVFPLPMAAVDTTGTALGITLPDDDLTRAVIRLDR